MALKPGRYFIADSIEYYMNAVGERGGIVCQTAVGSSGVTGEGLDSSSRVVAYQSNPSGLMAVGLLMWDAVNKDLSQTHLNGFKSEFQVGGKAYLLTKGRAVTNMWLPNLLPSGNATYPCPLYVGGSGLLAAALTAATATAIALSGYPLAGRVLTGLDSDGYAEIQVDL